MTSVGPQDPSPVTCPRTFDLRPRRYDFGELAFKLRQHPWCDEVQILAKGGGMMQEIGGMVRVSNDNPIKLVKTVPLYN